MEELLDDMQRCARRCGRASKLFDRDVASSLMRRLTEAVDTVEASFCGSWLGYHARIYISGFARPTPGEIFDATNEGTPFDRGRGRWMIYDEEFVRKHIIQRAGTTETELEDVIVSAAKAARAAFEQSKSDLLPAFDALLTVHDDEVLKALREKLVALQDTCAAERFVSKWRPTQQYTLTVTLAASQGFFTPPHVQFRAWLLEQHSYAVNADGLAAIARHAITYLRHKYSMKGRTTTGRKVFIGHGGSPVWKDLRHFLEDRLELETVEFNSISAAGYSNKQRLETMLEDSCFAFLLMTAEDEHADQSKHARENVIHEAGLFQGRLGFEKAIIVLEEECAQFSNIEGLGQIRFPKGNVAAKFEEVRMVLEREKIISP